MDKLIKQIRLFTEERDWNQFHTPRNLAISIVLEATEVLEKFQWKMDNQISDAEIPELKEEVADVLIYTLRLCDILDIDPKDAILKKLEVNKLKYPVEKSRGKSTKYTKL